MTDIGEINLPKPLKVKPSIAKYLDDLEEQGKSIYSFAGVHFVVTLAYLYLLNKYQSKCFTRSSAGIFSSKYGALLGLIFPLKLNFTKQEESELTKQFKDISIILANCVKRGENTIIIPLSYLRGTSGHANVLILRANKGELEHFEPQIEGLVENQRLQEKAKQIITFFVNILNKEFKKENLPQIKYVDASEVCPYISGLQDLEVLSKLSKKGKSDPGGYCLAWSLFFTELCLKNPDISSSELLDNIYNYLTTKSSGPDYLKGVIRGYAGFITQQVETYLSIFFKRKLTVRQIVDIESKATHKILDEVLNIIVDLETYIAMNPEFDLRKELKKAMKEYRDLTKGKTKEEQIQMRRGVNSIKKVRDAYYKKRILQNYEEYKRVGRVSEPIFDSPEEISREKIKNIDILRKGLLQERTEETKEPVKTRKQMPPTGTRAKTQKNLFSKKDTNLMKKIIKEHNIDVTTKEGQLKLLKILQDMGNK